LLDSADTKALRPCLALQAFCGIRTAEILRLNWSDIDVTRGWVHVAADQSKTATRRPCEISPNLREWLLPYGGRKGKLWPKSSVEYHRALERARIAAGMVAWPSNGLRHSYASYHLAEYQNAPALALQMGHASSGMIFSHYREVVTPAEAARYWDIRPKQAAENIVPMEVAVI
jgi:integrase